MYRRKACSKLMQTGVTNIVLSSLFIIVVLQHFSIPCSTNYNSGRVYLFISFSPAKDYN